MVQSPIIIESAWGVDHQWQEYTRKELQLERLQTKASWSFSKLSSIELLTTGWLGLAYFGSGLRLKLSPAKPWQHYSSSDFTELPQSEYFSSLQKSLNAFYHLTYLHLLYCLASHSASPHIVNPCPLILLWRPLLSSKGHFFIIVSQ